MGASNGSDGEPMGPLLQQTHVKGGAAPLALQVMRQLRRERSWAPVICRPALRASLMAALSGWLVVLTVSHAGSRACSSAITTA